MRVGGWLDAKTPERFARYCKRVARHLGDLIGIGCTVNEPNIAAVLGKILNLRPEGESWWQAAAEFFGVPPNCLGANQFVARPEAREVILAAHRRGYEAIKSVRSDIQLGLTLALHDFQHIPGGESKAAGIRRDLADCYLEAVRGDDLVGVQNYARVTVWYKETGEEVLRLNTDQWVNVSLFKEDSRYVIIGSGRQD